MSIDCHECQEPFDPTDSVFCPSCHDLLREEIPPIQWLTCESCGEEYETLTNDGVCWECYNDIEDIDEEIFDEDEEDSEDE